MSNNQKFILFLLCWVALNIVTATNTDLYADEAYYWMYSQFLDWGYFDHPPMVALMIKFGEWFGKNEFAVRILNITLTACSLYVIYHLVKPRNVTVFALTLFGFLIFHIIGFVSLPDGPFLFFSLLYLCVYNKFMHNKTFMNQLLVGVFAALMLYSKYHGGLVILLSIASNVKILKHYGIYVAGIIALAILSPHVYWQYKNDFPSFLYHVVSRGSADYSINQTLDFVFSNIPFHGGLIALVLFVATFFIKSHNAWEKLLKWNLYGVFAFFFLVTFNGQYIEANWTLSAVFPLLFLGYRKIENSPAFNSYRVLVIIFAPVMLLLRVHLVHPLFTVAKDRVWDFHYGSQFAHNVDSLTHNNYLVANRYQDASFLNFYLNKNYLIPAVNIHSRENQYGIWQFESTLCSKDIAYVNNHLQGMRVITLFEEKQVSLLENVIFQSCIDLRINNIFIDDNQLIISLDSTQNFKSLHNALQQFEISLELYGEDKLLIMDTRFPAEHIVQRNDSLYYSVDMEKNINAQSVKLFLISEKLGGSDNKAIYYQIKE